MRDDRDGSCTPERGVSAEAPEGRYDVRARETLAQAPGLRVRALALSEGQEVPWHLHTVITDTFFCMRGPMQVHLRRPQALHRLHPGDTLAVEPGRPHRVTPDEGGSCRFMIVQGVGEYDFVPVDD